MATNQEKLDGTYWAVTQEGRDFADRHTFSETTYPNAWGHQFTLLQILNGVERRVQEQNAQIAGLVGALKAVSGGQSFDEAKLLAGVKAAAAAGTAEAIQSIETTVTVKGA
jgi:hypothetical protein